MESYSKERSWNAWHGDFDQLKRLAAVVSELHSQRLGEATIGESSDADDLRLTALQMSIRERIDHYAGPLDAMIEQFDRRTALGIEFRSQIGDDRIIMELAGSRVLAEIELSVSSSDPAHTRLAFARISDEVDRGVPWWGKIHSGILLGSLTYIAVGCILTSGVLIVGHFRHVTTTQVWQSCAAALAIALVLAIPSGFIAGIFGVGPRWLFPKFEVTGDGVSSASRRLWSFIGILLTVPVGIVINYLS